MPHRGCEICGCHDHVCSIEGSRLCGYCAETYYIEKINQEFPELSEEERAKIAEKRSYYKQLKEMI